jgi:hypothetical protein
VSTGNGGAIGSLLREGGGRHRVRKGEKEGANDDFMPSEREKENG